MPGAPFLLLELRVPITASAMISLVSSEMPQQEKKSQEQRRKERWWLNSYKEAKGETV